ARATRSAPPISFASSARRAISSSSGFQLMARQGTALRDPHSGGAGRRAGAPARALRAACRRERARCARAAGLRAARATADPDRVSRPRLRRRLIACAAWAALAPAAGAAVYDVGPAQPLAAIGEVPWHLLEPGDEVRIHWRAEPYREKWVIGRSGTAQAPIVVRGIPGPNGERPVIRGDGATTPDPLDYTGEARSV